MCGVRKKNLSSSINRLYIPLISIDAVLSYNKKELEDDDVCSNNNTRNWGIE